MSSASVWRLERLSLPKQLSIALALAACTLTLAAGSAAASDQILFPAVDNAEQAIVNRINAETVRIDMSAWYLTDRAITQALVNRFKAGVPVRLLGDRVAIFESDPNTKNEFYWVANQGIPIRLRYYPTWFPEIDHWKATIFVGQNTATFGSSNYTPFELLPFSPTNFKDETVLFTDDLSIVRAVKMKFDQMWNDTTPEPNSIIQTPPFMKNWYAACDTESTCDFRTRYPNPAPMQINTARLEPDVALPPDIVWGQGAPFNNRMVAEINRETSAIDLVVYRLTVDSITEALLSRARSGVRVRIILEPDQYTSKVWPEYWLTHSNIDKLWAAGVSIKIRAHQGLTHMKMLVTSRYATNASSNYAENWQRDINYFVPQATKPAIYNAMRNRFQTMWTDTTNFRDFTPLRADEATLVGPAQNASGISRRPTLVWNRAAFATSYDVYLGTTWANMAKVANVPAVLTSAPPPTYSWTPSATLASGSNYVWRIVARTFATDIDASLVAPSEVWSFSTLGWVSGDFDGDRKSDLTVFRPSTGVWYTLNSSTGASSSLAWGMAADRLVPRDYDGDGRVDIAVFRPSNGMWHIVRSGTGTPMGFAWGNSADIPVPADYDGDGKADIAVFRPSNAAWYVVRSSTGVPSAFAWGSSADVPVPGDYDGDGKTDLAVYRPSNGVWHVLNSSTGTPSFVAWGNSTDLTVPGDYDGDGKTDIAIYRPSNGGWYVLRSSTGTPSAAAWGNSTDVPVPGDFDGDGKTDFAIYRPSNGGWYVLNSRTGTPSAVVWGISGDIPILKRP